MDDAAEPRTRRRTQRTAAERRLIMARFHAGGLTDEAFCAAAGIGSSAFWRWRLADEDAARRQWPAGVRRTVRRGRRRVGSGTRPRRRTIVKVLSFRQRRLLAV